MREVLIQQIGFVSTQQQRAGRVDIAYAAVAVEGKITHRGEIKKIRISAPFNARGRLLFWMG